MSTLYIVATPIGNLHDFSPRALETLKKVDLIIAEDTQVTRTLCAHFAIDAPLISFHEHTKPHELRAIVERIVGSVSSALVCDAGTPVIADPGAPLIRELRKQASDTRIIPIPGPSSVIAALSVSGLWGNQFVFFGFGPQKKGRQAFFKKVEDSEMTVVFLEAPQRMKKTIVALGGFADLDRKIVICRELTKQFETIYYTTVGEIVNAIPEKDMRGEFVIVVEGKRNS